MACRWSMKMSLSPAHPQVKFSYPITRAVHGQSSDKALEKSQISKLSTGMKLLSLQKAGRSIRPPTAEDNGTAFIPVLQITFWVYTFLITNLVGLQVGKEKSSKQITVEKHGESYIDRKSVV